MALFVPDKICIGFQTRKDTYTGRLAYIIYWDKKGKLRKETSWQSWRDKKINQEEFENTPQDGFILNKGMTRYAWSSFGSNRTIIRIYDSRGIEFEITPENLVGILTETNCMKRGLDGKFVYAWKGADLVLLPCVSQEYTEAVEHTALQGKKISARDLVPGCSYTTKKNEEVIYIGRFPWFKWSYYRYSSSKGGRISQKKHVFAWGKQKGFFPKNDATFLAELNSPDPIQGYAELVDKFNADIHSSVITKWETNPCKPSFEETNTAWDGPQMKRHAYTEMHGDVITFWCLSLARKHYTDTKPCGYKLTKDGTLNVKTYKYESAPYYVSPRFGYSSGQVLTQQEVSARLAVCVDIKMVLSSGKKIHLKSISSLSVE